ncbi:MAG: acetolactate synthase small subunit [bacterium]
MKHIISVLVENKFGVLARIVGLFSARGFNIDSLSVGETNDPDVSRMTIVTRGDDSVLEQITKQLNKLINVIKVIDLPEGSIVEREMLLIKVSAEPEQRAELMRITEIFKGKIVDANPKTFTIEVTGDDEKIEAMLTLLRPLGIKEVVRSGKIAIGRQK